MVKPLEECEFGAFANKQGMFIGRCREYPDLRTRPRKSRLDAIDDIIAATRDKIRDIHAAMP
jgi:hypothetical protein